MFNLAGIATPTIYLKKHYRSHVHGFTLPFAMGDNDSILIPLIWEDRIETLADYRTEANKVQLAETSDHEGASQLMVGQPALYTFVFHTNKRMRCYTAIKPLLIPHLRQWLSAGSYGETDDNAIRQAEVFCEGKTPPELNEQYAEVELHLYRNNRRA